MIPLIESSNVIFSSSLIIVTVLNPTKITTETRITVLLNQ
jgi:hypothetical protein